MIFDMKQNIFIIIFFVLSFSSFATGIPDIKRATTYEHPEFWQLSPEEKVQKLLEEFRYNSSWNRHSKYNRYVYILTENPEENIPVLLDYLEKTDKRPLSEDDFSFQILRRTLSTFMTLMRVIGVRQLNEVERTRFRIILQEKIHVYLETYKIIDYEVALTESIIQNDIFLSTRPNIYQELFIKYTGLGFRDLTIVYPIFQTEEENNEIFRYLPAREKVQLVLNELQYDFNWGNRLSPNSYIRIISQNPEENIPILFEYL